MSATAGTHSPASPYRIDVVHRAVRILLEFRQPPHAFGISELSRRTEVSAGVCFRLVKTLEEAGLLERSARGGPYRLGLLALELAHAAGQSAELMSVADDVLRGLEVETEETVNLLVRDGWGALCVAQREGSRAIKVSARIGRRWNALHAGASPKAILAALPDGEIERYVREHGLDAFTPATITDPEALWHEVQTIRDTGVAWSDEDTDPGVQAVAAPIRGEGGRVIAAVGVAGPADRLRGDRAGRIRLAVQEAAATISRRMGFLGPETGSGRTGEPSDRIPKGDATT